MRRYKKYLLLLVVAVLVLALQFCKKKNDHFSLIPVNEYYPLEVGKYIVYRMDSTVFENFGTERKVLSRQVRDLVDAEITDNNNRKSYRIRRMTRNADGTGDWVDNSTFMVTPLANSIEIVENNLRTIKLKAPVKDFAYWKGNSYINTIEDLAFMRDWDYTFQDVGQPYTVPAGVIENSATVLQYFSATGDPVFSPTSYADSTYSVEVYGQDIGLIYKDFIHWVYQPRYVTSNCKYIKCNGSVCDTVICSQANNCDSLRRVDGGQIVCDTLSFRYAYEGYGIKMSMLEHN